MPDGRQRKGGDSQTGVTVTAVATLQPLIDAFAMFSIGEQTYKQAMMQIDQGIWITVRSLSFAVMVCPPSGSDLWEPWGPRILWTPGSQWHGPAVGMMGSLLFTKLSTPSGPYTIMKSVLLSIVFTLLITQPSLAFVAPPSIFQTTLRIPGQAALRQQTNGARIRSFCDSLRIT